MECPVCRVALVVVERRGVELDWCPDCRGLWFDEGEIELLAERSGSRIAPGPAAARAGADAGRRCPRCARRMARTTLGAGAVPTERCERHGLWFDGGALERLPAHAAGGAAPAEGPILEFLGDVLGGVAPATPGGS